MPTSCGEVLVPPEHLEACRTCNADGLKCDMIKEGGTGVKDVDFVLYVSAIATPQCGESIGKNFLSQRCVSSLHDIIFNSFVCYSYSGVYSDCFLFVPS